MQGHGLSQLPLRPGQCLRSSLWAVGLAHPMASSTPGEIREALEDVQA